MAIVVAISSNSSWLNWPLVYLNYAKTGNRNYCNLSAYLLNKNYAQIDQNSIKLWQNILIKILLVKCFYFDGKSMETFQLTIVSQWLRDSDWNCNWTFQITVIIVLAHFEVLLWLSANNSKQSTIGKTFDYLSITREFVINVHIINNSIAIN